MRIVFCGRTAVAKGLPSLSFLAAERPVHLFRFLDSCLACLLFYESLEDLF